MYFQMLPEVARSANGLARVLGVTHPAVLRWKGEVPLMRQHQLRCTRPEWFEPMVNRDEDGSLHSYPFRPVEYAKQAALLSDAEDLAYRRLLDAYYTSGGPLPGSYMECARLIRMLEKLEAVTYVLEKHFVQTPEGWRHEQADATLAIPKEGKLK